MRNNMSKLSTASLCFLLFACRNDTGVKVYNDLPEATIMSHPDESEFFVGDVVEFYGSVSDGNHDAEDLEASWFVGEDAACAPATPDDGGNTSCVITLEAEHNSVRLEVRDPEDGGGNDTITILVSTGEPPVIVLTEPEDGEIYAEGDSVTFSAEITDVDDAFDAITVEWKSDLDSIISTQGPDAGNIAQFATSNLSAGTHNITVTATDSRGLPSTALTSITINGVPSQPTVSITPDPANTTEHLTASASGSEDPDGQAVTYDYEWLLNGSTVTSGAQLDASNTNRGETWTVRATPSDGINTGLAGEASITISNAPPEVVSVSISPNSPSTQDTLTCSATTSDPDGDTVTVSYQWLVDGNPQSSTTDTLSGPFQQGNEVTCRVTPNDGSDDGDFGEGSVIINNSPPTIASVTLSPSPVYTNDILTAVVSATDPEGDAMTYTFEWYVDSQLVQTNTTSSVNDTLDGVGGFDKDQQVYADVTATDTAGAYSSLQSTTITVSNTAPSAFNELITPSSPAAGADDLVCSAQTSDADGDAVTMTYEWSVDGVLSTSYTTDTIPAEDTADGEEWMCTMTPDDGTDSGTPVSVSVTVGADAPGAVGMGWCASAGHVTNSMNELTFCLSPVGLAGGESSNASYTLQQGPIYRFRPE